MGGKTAYDDAVLPNFYVVSDGRCLNHRVRANMNMVSYLHGIIVEVATIGLVRWPFISHIAVRDGSQDGSLLTS